MSVDFHIDPVATGVFGRDLRVVEVYRCQINGNDSPALDVDDWSVLGVGGVSGWMVAGITHSWDGGSQFDTSVVEARQPGGSYTGQICWNGGGLSACGWTNPDQAPIGIANPFASGSGLHTLRIFGAWVQNTTGGPTGLDLSTGCVRVAGVCVDNEVDVPPEPPEPGPIVDVYDGDDVLLATLPAKDVRIRVELDDVGSGSFKVNRYAPEATAAILKPGNYVRVTIPQIDPAPIFGFFLDDGDFRLVASGEKGAEDIGFSGHGSLSYWTRAIWLAQSFLVDWWPAYMEAEHGPPPAGTLGMVRFSPGTYSRFTVSGSTITGKISFTSVPDGFSSYYDSRKRYTRTIGGVDYTVTLVHLTTAPAVGWYAKPYGAGVFERKARAYYRFGDSVLMQSIDDGNKPGQVLRAMYDEAFAATRPINPIPRMTVDFDSTTDSNGDAWSTTDALAAVSAELGDDYLSTIGKLVSTGALDVEMTPDLLFRAFNALGVDRTASAFAAGKVRFVKGTNIADELMREFSDPPLGTFAEVLGPNDGDVGRATLAGDYPPREISVRGDSSDTAALEALGEAELARRLVHSDAVGFNVGVPMIGREDDLVGLYVPGPPGSANGKYWPGDYVRLHTGDGENDFDEADVRIAAITMWFGEAGGLRASVEVGSGLGGLPVLGYPGSTGGLPTAGGGTGSSSSDLFQLTSELDQPNGYPSLTEEARVAWQEVEVSWKRSVRLATTGPVTLSSLVVGAALDGETLAEADEILVKDQAAAEENGIRVVDASGAPARRSDLSVPEDVLGAVVLVREGTANGGTSWMTTNLAPAVIDTDPISWIAFVTPSGVADILDLPTAETDTTLVLAPDGVGGVEFRTESGGGGGVVYPLDETPLHATYGDDFAAASLDAKWTRHNITSGAEAYQQGDGSWLEVTMPTALTDYSYFQPAPAGDFEVQFTQELYSASTHMYGPMIISSAGAGVGLTPYDNSNVVFMANLSAYAYSTSGGPDNLLTLAYQRGEILYLAIKKVGTVYTFRWSRNGVLWTPYSTGVTNAFTVDRIGFGRFFGTGAHRLRAGRFNVV